MENEFLFCISIRSFKKTTFVMVSNLSKQGIEWEIDFHLCINIFMIRIKCTATKHSSARSKSIE
ncbi:hypothetical protein BES34_013430 [Leptospira inadai serovar Lyme]|uniref:Uncharacterized protein n=1 Tax=Leptospira inadai serovar Lyme TaxID=293084 RepID=A0ABX4YH98_9LEPT|nr:hypothetical protein BES34_013430 [Leptospira inadai serovar Lyme]